MSPTQEASLHAVMLAGNRAHDPISSHSPVVPQVFLSSALQKSGSGRPAEISWHRPTEPVWLQAWQAPLQATLQQTWSAQKPELHSSEAWQVAPFSFRPQLLLTHCWPSAQRVAHDVSHLLVAGSQVYGRQVSASPATQFPLPSHTRPAAMPSPSQVPDWQEVSLTH